MRPTFVMKHYVRNAAAKIKFFMKNTYIIQGKDQFSLMKHNCGIIIRNLSNSNI